jgi:tetratricopeptide (TPR) repeat protein
MSKSLFYINLPPRLADQITTFSLNSSIPLPVEVPVDQKDNWDISKIEWPAIISGMIYELSLHPDGPDADYYRSLVKTIHPEIVPTMLTAAEIKVNKGEFSFAEELFLSLCALEPENPLHKSNLALFYQKKEDLLLLENSHYQKALDHLKKNEPEEGVAAVKAFLQDNPESGNGWFLLGWAKRQQKQWEEALGAFMKSTSFAPPTVELHNEISLCLSEMGELDKSIEAIKEGLKLDSKNTTLLSNLAVVYLRMNDLSRAEDIMNTLKEIDQNDPLVGQFFN